MSTTTATATATSTAALTFRRHANANRDTGIVWIAGPATDRRRPFNADPVMEAGEGAYMIYRDLGDDGDCRTCGRWSRRGAYRLSRVTDEGEWIDLGDYDKLKCAQDAAHRINAAA